MQTTLNNYPQNLIYILLQPGRNFINGININNPEFAKKLCELISSKCPFARDVKFFGRTILQIPPLCKLNPFYFDTPQTKVAWILKRNKFDATSVRQILPLMA